MKNQENKTSLMRRTVEAFSKATDTVIQERHQARHVAHWTYAILLVISLLIASGLTWRNASKISKQLEYDHQLEMLQAKNQILTDFNKETGTALLIAKPDGHVELITPEAEALLQVDEEELAHEGKLQPLLTNHAMATNLANILTNADQTIYQVPTSKGQKTAITIRDRLSSNKERVMILFLPDSKKAFK